MENDPENCLIPKQGLPILGKLAQNLKRAPKLNTTAKVKDAVAKAKESKAKRDARQIELARLNALQDFLKTAQKK